MATSLAEGQLISPNSSITFNGFWFNCTVTETAITYRQGAYIRFPSLRPCIDLVSEPRCTLNGSELHLDQTMRNGTFQWSCQEAGLWIVGCYINNETGDILLPLGKTLDFGPVRHHCAEVSSNPGRVQYWTTAVEGEDADGDPDATSAPEATQNPALQAESKLWTHYNAEAFVKNVTEYNTKVRRLIFSWT